MSRFQQSFSGFIFSFSLLLFFVVSCSEFCEGECFEETTLFFNILNKSDSTDLIINNSQFDIADLEAYTIVENDSIFYTIELNNSNESVAPTLSLDYKKLGITTVFLKLKTFDTDTLTLITENLGKVCCYGGDVYRLKTVEHNGIEVFNRASDPFYFSLYK